jgi:hypothetical protein
MRPLLLAFALSLAACGQGPTPPALEAPSESVEAESTSLAALLAPTISEEIGVPVTLQVRHLAVMNEWAWLIADPRQADGAALDWSASNLASAYENGAMDESGATYALFTRENGAWRVVAYTIAPTDVAWESWPEQYGAPALLFERAAEPTP